MIVKMKKVSLVIFDKYREQSLKKLRKVGVMHLDPLAGNGEQYDVVYSMNEKIKHALNLLPGDRQDEPVDFRSIEDSLEKADQIAEVSDRHKKVKDRINAYIKEIERVQPLGDFDPAIAAELAGKGLGVTLFMINKSDEEIFRSNGAFSVADTKTKSFYAMIGEVPEALSGFEVFHMPEHGLGELGNLLEEAKKELLDVDEELGRMTSCRDALKKGLELVGTDLEFEAVRSGINVEDMLSYLTGYCPVDRIEKLKSEARDAGWGLLIEDPGEEDPVPTELRLGKFASLLSPVLDFLGILPGYREYDISFFFLCFFSIFTAMLIGDAGYGLIFLGVTVAGMIAFGRKGKQIPKIFFMLLLLSVTTIAYGIVTGTWFASQTILSWGPLESLKMDVFKGSDTEQIAVVMGISFFLGIVQLLIGVVQNFRKNFPKKSSFAQIGWFAVLIAIYYLVLTLVVKRAGLETYPTQMLYLLLAGVVIIFLFGGQEEGKSFLKGILNSCANFLQLFLDVVGTFSDIMSYVRLFAVGLASVKIAETFNQLAAQMSEGWLIIFGILIVIIGHTMNIVLGLMAILVHAVRLNILEYSGKVGVEWSGFKYDPFRVDADEKQV